MGAPAPYEGRFGAAADLRRLAGRGALVNACYQLGLAGVVLVRGLAAAAFVSQTDYGLWGLLGIALWTAQALRAVGINDKYVQQSAADQQLAFQRAFTIELVFAGFSVVAMLALAPGLAALTGHSELVLPGLLLAVVVPASALQFPLWTYYRQMDFRRLRVLQAVEPVTSAVVTIALAAAGAGYWSFVAGLAAGAWAGALAALRASQYPVSLKWDPATARTYLRFSAPIVITGLSTLVMFAVIYLVGNEEVGVASLGAFTVAGNVLVFTHRADAIVTEALYPALCAVRDRTEVLFEAFVKSNRLALLWAVPFGVALSLFASDLVEFLLGGRWSEAVGVLQIMGALAAVQHLGFNWHAFYRARGTTGPIAVTAVVGAGVFVAAAIPLMRAHGIEGIAWAFLIAEVAALALRTAYLRRLFPLFRSALHFVRAFVPTAAAGAVVVAARGVSDAERTALLAVGELLAYAAVVVLVSLATERRLLREALGYVTTRPARA